MSLRGLHSKTDEVSELASLLNLRVLTATICDKDSLQSFIDHISTNALKLKVTALNIDDFDLVSTNEGSVLFRKALMCGSLHYLALSVEMNKFPSYEPQMLQNLVSVQLEKNKMEDDPMQVLEMLPRIFSH